MQINGSRYRWWTKIITSLSRQRGVVTEQLPLNPTSKRYGGTRMALYLSISGTKEGGETRHWQVIAVTQGDDWGSEIVN